MALTQTRAEARSSCIQSESISYRFHLSLQSGSFYDGLSQICFSLLHIPESLPLDCRAKQIQQLYINKEEIKDIKAEEGFLFLDPQKLKVGENLIFVLYRTKYDNDGNGCVSFVDVDSKQYLYTQFQPYYANRVFALFDQPDLKAPMQLSIISPYEWEKVLSNEYSVIDDHFDYEKFMKEVSTWDKGVLQKWVKNKKGRMSIFPKTKLISTYLYCFVAGPYRQLELKERYKNIPMSLYCIQSLFQYLEKMAPFVFEITIESLKFFQSFFGCQFPFNKYDQIFAHQYKAGAMQNAGIVTFNDIYIYKDKVSAEKMQDLANTISHELSHHWFGNLVTMKWWDDLWLNESFAEFISHFCNQKIKNNLKTVQYQSSMASFLARKAWGYHEDQLVTTHPISGKVENTIVADSIFDGITYSKGASTMKQLLLLMSEQKFSAALKDYFKKYGWKNATLQDFIEEMQMHFSFKEFTLKEWKHYWLETASLNEFHPKWDPYSQAENSILTVRQTPFAQEYPTLRPHKIKIAFFKEDCTYDIIETYIKPETENAVQYNGSNQYKAILLNYEDYTFAKVFLDEVSLNFFSKNVIKIPDILTRTLIWRSFFDMVKDGFIASTRYIEMFLSNITDEKSDSIFERHCGYIFSAINTYTPRKHRKQLNEKIFVFLLNLIKTIHPSQENRLVIVRAKICQFALSQQAIKILLDWKKGEYQGLKNQKMTIGQQWATVVKAFTLQCLSIEQKEELFEQQKKLDNSDTSKLKRATCDSLKASREEFEKIYENFKNPQNQQSITYKRAVATGWNHAFHLQWLKEFKGRYFKDMMEVSKTLQGDHFQFFIEELEPIDDNLEETIEEYRKIKFEGEKYDKNNRDMLKMIDDLRRRKKAYSLFD